ncbi:thioredoxin family protein [Legionella israelensis]|uniref:thioredoxin family protein n=1 Tax=Legionella israelensis TaxID=454 RepID=UPI001181672A|nr:thioredoxin family protein [Legionella israelensis]QDP72836.1 thioredoxin family protein [Legionella israelensis]
MVKTASNMLTLGTKAPEFNLTDVTSGKKISLIQYAGKKATVIMFICNHCPYVKYINSELSHLAHEYMNEDIRFIAINSNDVEQYPDDSPEKMRETAKINNYPFPYLFDESQEVAAAYHAACTPDFYIFDKNLELVYRGQFDDSRPGNNIPVTGQSIRDALNSILNDEAVDELQKPSLGCNIKWKKE